MAFRHQPPTAFDPSTYSPVSTEPTAPGGPAASRASRAGTLGAAHRRIAAILFVAALFSYSGFQQDTTNPNVASRLLLDVSIITHRTVTIDPYAPLTQDKAAARGHFYSDKAPGQSLLALPVLYAAWHPLMAGHPGAPDSPLPSVVWPRGYYRVAYVATLATSALLTAASVTALFFLAAAVFESTGAAVVVAAVYGFATPALGWATTFVGHAAAMALLALGLTLLHFAGNTAGAKRHAALRVAAGVACLTWAVVTEFTAAPAAAAITVYAAPRILATPDRRGALVLTAISTAAVASIPLLVYNTLAFGSPWHLGYQSVQGFVGMQRGLFGIGAPDLHVLAEITIGARRGLLRLSPVLALAPVALTLMIWQGGVRRALGTLCVAVVVYYLLMNSGYFYWDGGWSTGPRHLTAMLPFAVLPLGAMWQRGPNAGRTIVAVLALVSAGLAVLCASSGMFSPAAVPNEVRDFVLGNARDGLSTALIVRHAHMRLETFLGLLAATWTGVAALVAGELGKVAAAGTGGDAKVLYPAIARPDDLAQRGSTPERHSR